MKKTIDSLSIKVIGCGGIGTNLLNILCRFLNSIRIPVDLTLIDGDEYELKNLDRQEFKSRQIGLNKARAKFESLRSEFLNMNFHFIPKYVNESNLNDIIISNDVVFMGVDNHTTRLMVSQHCQSLNDIILISGGNDYIDGNVQIYRKEKGKSKYPTIEDYHPEIQDPKDKSPEDMSCEELQNVEPQLGFANATIAVAMCCAFWNVLFNPDGDGGIVEAYYDITLMKANSYIRRPKSEHVKI